MPCTRTELLADIELLEDQREAYFAERCTFRALLRRASRQLARIAMNDNDAERIDNDIRAALAATKG